MGRLILKADMAVVYVGQLRRNTLKQPPKCTDKYDTPVKCY